ncbi:MAG: hypothetical protein R3B99_13525 [Polyangiales bacterium]
MAQRKARIRVEVTGADRLQKVLRGIREGERRGAREDQRREKRRTTDEAQEQRKRTRTRKQHRDQDLAEEQRAVRTKKSLEREVTREVEQQARARTRSRRAQARAERSERSRGGIGAAIGRFGAGVYGAGNAVAGRIGQARGALGVSSTQERIQSFIRAEQDFIRLAGQGGLSPDRQRELWTQIGGTARATNTDPESIIEGLTVAQNRFSDLEGFAANIEAIARVAQVSKAPMSDWIGAIGEFQRQMGVTTEEVPELIGMVAQAARDGSVEAGDIAASFSDQMARFAMFRGGRGGMPQARELMGVAEVVAAGSGTKGPEARTLVSNLMTALSESRAQRSIERATGNRELFDDRGILRVSFAELFGQMSEARNDPFRSDQQMQRMGIGSSEARTALGAIISQFERGSDVNPLRDFDNTSSAEGNAMIESTFGQMISSESGRALSTEVAGQVAMMENGSDVVRALNAIVGPMDELTSRYPLATEAIGTFAEALQSAGMGIAAANFLGLGSSQAALTSAAAPGLGATAGGGMLGSVLGALGLGGALAARGGYELSEGLTGSDSIFAGGVPGARRELERARQRGGEGAVRERLQEGTQFMREGVLGMAMRFAGNGGGERIMRVILEPDSRQALASDVARAARGAERADAGGPARRGGG